jgi:hypothetical protein
MVETKWKIQNFSFIEWMVTKDDEKGQGVASLHGERGMLRKERLCRLMCGRAVPFRLGFGHI